MSKIGSLEKFWNCLDHPPTCLDNVFKYTLFLEVTPKHSLSTQKLWDCQFDFRIWSEWVDPIYFPLLFCFQTSKYSEWVHPYNWSFYCCFVSLVTWCHLLDTVFMISTTAIIKESGEDLPVKHWTMPDTQISSRCFCYFYPFVFKL